MFSTYLDLAVTIAPSGLGGYSVSIQAPGGDARSELLPPDDIQAYQALAARLQNPDADESTLTELGQLLFRAIFQNTIKEAYVRSQGLLAEGQGLRLRLEMDADAAVAGLPWELLYDPDRGPLTLLDTPIVRYLPQQSRIPTLKIDLPLKVLVTAAQTSPLIDVGRELQILQAALGDL